MSDNRKAFKNEKEFLDDIINRHSYGAKSVVRYGEIAKIDMNNSIDKELDMLRGYNYAMHSGVSAKYFEIKDVIFNDPATIVFWSDGSKTVVKCEHEAFDPEKGLAMAIAKRAFGNQGSYYNIFKKWLPEQAVLYADNKPIVKTFVKDGD